MSFGGHGDLQRVMRYLCSGNAPPMPALGEATHDIPGAEHVSIDRRTTTASPSSC